MRGCPDNFEVMDTEDGLGVVVGQEKKARISDVDVSRLDCSISSKTE